jgi:hypothetical protein
MSNNLQARLREQPVPEPDPGLRERIVASRAAGERVILPPVSAPRSRVTVALVATAAVLLAVLLWPRQTGPETHDSIFVGTPFWPTSGYGQEPSDLRDTLGRARYPLLDRVSSHDLQLGTWSYQATMTTDGLVTTSQGDRQFSIASISRDGTPALAIVTTGRGRYNPEGFFDSLVVTRDSLRVLRRFKQYGINPFGKDYAPGQPPLSWKDADINWVGSVYRALFQLSKLSSTWRGSVYVPWIPQGNRVRVIPIDLRVTGSERVTVPAGSFESWVVSVRFRDQEARVYVSRDRGWVVKISMPMGEDAVWEQALTAQRPA